MTPPTPSRVDLWDSTLAGYTGESGCSRECPFRGDIGNAVLLVRHGETRQRLCLVKGEIASPRPTNSWSAENTFC